MALARLWNSTGRSTEIVSCDSMQVYRRMDIGTAKPGADERREVPHHMIDVAEPTEDHDLPRFLEAARRLGVEPTGCVVFEDSDLGLVAAERAGMVGVDVRPWYRSA